jgi:glycosyltransferase involved in cell wall biosynthesis
MTRTVQVAADTAAVMVTRDGARFLGPQLDSILSQDLLPATLVVVDDASRDGTREIIREAKVAAPIPVELIEVDGSGAPDVKTRIASNVATGLAAASEYRIAVLADQDDIWLPARLSGQRSLLIDTAGGLLVSGDGLFIDSNGREIGGRLRRRFPLPDGWEAMDAASRARAALRRPIVTGAASAVTAELVRLMSPIPRGWLHDRWATLIAVACGGLLVQAEAVIRYRIHDAQTIGERQATIGAEGPRWRQVLRRGATPLEALNRAVDIVRRVRPMATDPAVRSELSWGAVLRSGADRA